MSVLPALRVESVRKVFDDGQHDAFTDLCRFRGGLFLTCRSCPDGHMVFATSRIVVLTSTDGGSWTEVFSFRVADRDVRDPHFLLFGDTLFVYTGTWLVPREGEERDLNEHLGYAAWTADGQAWQGPRLLEGTYGHYVWRAAAWGGRAYLCGRRRRAFAPRLPHESDPACIEGAMLESEDGLVWRHRTLFTEEHGDETAFLFEAGGTCVALARGTSEVPARLCRAAPPYTRWQRVALDRNVGGPLLVRWGAHYLVGGRDTSLAGSPRTALCWLAEDRLHGAAVLPSAGDNSYPGFVALDERRGLLSYYSSHEGGTSVYLAVIQQEAGR
ncbi:MAG: hypothetical protein AB1505_09740 [Candidatus Latescibacterota bacterium]